MRPALAVVIPARNEASRLPALLADLAQGRQLIAECLVVDGGSSDATASVARLAGARVLQTGPGRGPQLVEGIASTTAPWLWLLHADVRLPAHWPQRLQALLAGPPAAATAWYGDLRVELPGIEIRLLEALVGLRSDLGQRPYGDQGLLIPRDTYAACGGLRPLPLMEDLEFAQRFAGQGRFRRLGLPLRVDGRRWRQLGLVRTSLANAALRRAWRQGTPPDQLAQRYGAYQKAQRRSLGSSSQPWAW